MHAWPPALRTRPLRTISRSPGASGGRSSLARLGAARVSDLFCWPRRFQNVHPDDQPVLKPITVPDPGLRDDLAGARVVGNLVDIDRDRVARLLGENLGCDLARDRGELPVPVLADR